MGFTDTRKPVRERAENDTGSSGFVQPWTWPIVGKGPKGNKRIIRILPEVENGKLVLNKTGRTEPETPVQFRIYWFKFPGQQYMTRVIIDKDNGWDNPLREHLWSTYGEDEKNPTNGFAMRQMPRAVFAFNVWDKTPVIIKDGKVVYPGLHDEYILDGKELKDTPAPFNKVTIFEGTSTNNKPGKKSPNEKKKVWDTFMELHTGMESDDGRPLNLSESDLKLTCNGTYDVGALKGGSIQPLTPDIYLADRWDLQEWATPWPDQAVEELLAGADMQETLEKYGVVLYPRKYSLIPESNTGLTAREDTTGEEDNLF